VHYIHMWMDYLNIFHSLTFSLPLSPPVILSDRLTNTILFSLMIYMCRFIYIHIYILHICEHMIYPHIHLTYRSNIRENIWSLTLWAWLTSLNMKFSSSIHLPANNIISFFFNLLWSTSFSSLVNLGCCRIPSFIFLNIGDL
jgi:hypothetical protein